jgi:hypothetical protein
MSGLSRPVGLALVVVLVALPGTAFARPNVPASPGIEATSEPARVAAGAGGTTQWTFSTRDRQFLPHTSNQGWWSNAHNAKDSNDNYVVGRCCGGGEFRDFFTFALNGLTGTVKSAQLVLRKFKGRGGPYEKYGLSDVATAAPKLNANSGEDPKIFKDLGRGTGYGVFRLSTKDETTPDDVFTLNLNANALSAIHKAAGGFFSIGGMLLSLKNGGFLFAGSGGRGQQELIVTTKP